MTNVYVLLDFISGAELQSGIKLNVCAPRCMNRSNDLRSSIYILLVQSILVRKIFD